MIPSAWTDGGSLCCVDVRSSTSLFTEDSAHTSALSSLSPSVTGCLVTASTNDPLLDLTNLWSSVLVDSLKWSWSTSATTKPSLRNLQCRIQTSPAKLLPPLAVLTIQPTNSVSPDRHSTHKKIKKSKIMSLDLGSGSRLNHYSQVWKKSRHLWSQVTWKRNRWRITKLRVIRTYGAVNLFIFSSMLWQCWLHNVVEKQCLVELH